MHNKFENLRTYLPATKEIYDAITFNYFFKQKHDEIHLGEHLHINKKKDKQLVSSFDIDVSYWVVNYKGQEILNFYPILGFDKESVNRNRKYYEFYFTSSLHTKFITEEFFKFDQKTKDFLKENYFYEYTIINNLVKMLKNYVIRIFSLSDTLSSYYYDREMGEMFNLKFENMLDENHLEVALYMHDAYHQRIPLIEKGEIENFDELKVKEK